MYSCGIATLSEDELECEDHYRVELWPELGDRAEPIVLHTRAIRSSSRRTGCAARRRWAGVAPRAAVRWRACLAAVLALPGSLADKYWPALGCVRLLKRRRIGGFESTGGQGPRHRPLRREGPLTRGAQDEPEQRDAEQEREDRGPLRLFQRRVPDRRLRAAEEEDDELANRVERQDRGRRTAPADAWAAGSAAARGSPARRGSR